MTSSDLFQELLNRMEAIERGQERIEARMDSLESHVAGLKKDLAIVRQKATANQGNIVAAAADVLWIRSRMEGTE
ncbi:MAG: hypothetical protein F4Z17_04945 [Acidimicrobiia bacterium]|nr:hypothetical protein [Acidimicrobiia bacterium]